MRSSNIQYCKTAAIVRVSFYYFSGCGTVKNLEAVNLGGKSNKRRVRLRYKCSKLVGIGSTFH